MALIASSAFLSPSLAFSGRLLRKYFGGRMKVDVHSASLPFPVRATCYMSKKLHVVKLSSRSFAMDGSWLHICSVLFGLNNVELPFLEKKKYFMGNPASSKALKILSLSTLDFSSAFSIILNFQNQNLRSNSLVELFCLVMAVSNKAPVHSYCLLCLLNGNYPKKWPNAIWDGVGQLAWTWGEWCPNFQGQLPGTSFFWQVG